MTRDIMSDSHPHGDQQLVGYNDITGTVTQGDNSDKEDEMKIVLSESQPPHRDRQLLSYPESDSDGKPCNFKQQLILDEDFDEKIDLVLVPK